MNFTYENQGATTYLVYEIGAADTIDNLSLGMLTNNSISGLAPVLFTQMDDQKFIKYNVSAKVSGTQFFTGIVNKKRLLGVFRGIVNAMLSAEDYMLDANSIVLDMDYIFADVSTCETVLICLPVVDADVPKVDLSTFFRNIMFSTQFDQTENCDHVTQILNYLNRTATLSLSEFKKLLDNLGAARAPVPNAAPKAAPQSAPPQPAAPQRPAAQPAAPQPAAPQPAASQPAPARPAPQPPKAPQTPPPAKAAPARPQPTPAAPASAPRVAAPSPMNQQPQAPQNAPAGEQMSLFYLLQHYNKDNAAIYKAQKEAKKYQAPVQPGAPKQKGKSAPQPASAPPQAPKHASPGFAVPGQPAPASAAPRQPGAPVPPPQNVPPRAPAAPVPPQAPPQTPVTPPQAPVTPPQAPVAPPQPAPQPAPQGGSPLNFGGTTMLGGGQAGGTVVLGAAANASQISPYLIRTKNNERIPLNKPMFRIGKEVSYVDYCIGDNPAVSRSHANIVTRNNEFFVVDTNSTNRTFVDGVEIASNVETPLYHGAKIRFANENFEFWMY